MSNLDAIVNVVITSDGRGVSRKSFGIPHVIGRHDAFTEAVREYALSTALADLVADGILAGTPIYQTVQSLASSTPKPQKVLIGRLTTAYTHIIALTVKTGVVEEDKVFSFGLQAPNGGAITTISYTALSGDVENDVAVAVAALVDAVVDISAPAPAGAEIVATADNVDEMWLISDLNILDWDFADQTIDSNLANELAGLTAINDTWYGLLLADAPSAARITVLAAAIETQERIFGAVTRDTAVGDPVSTTDIMYTTNAAQLFRTYVIYSGHQSSHAAASWMGNRFPIDPGASTWSYKPLSGTTFDTLSSGFVTATKAKKGNYYIDIADLPVTREGRMASGEWIDVIRGRDWLKVRLQERIFGLLVNAPKIPYTDGGVAQIENVVKAQMTEGIQQTYLSDDPDAAPVVTLPKVSDVSPQNKIDRILPDVAFEATLAGAIHVVSPLQGTIKV